VFVRFKIPPPNSIPEAEARQLADALGQVGGDSSELAAKIRRGWTTTPEVGLSKSEGQLMLNAWPGAKLEGERALALKNSLMKYVQG
jgi:hypothetical protein